MTDHLVVADTAIRQDAEGRFCLNDLHKASGEEQRHRPKYWLENQQTKDLIAELEHEGGIPPSKTVQGKGKEQGTFVVKELVYAYAMWISPAFHLKVIRAYDALVSARIPPEDGLTAGLREGIARAAREVLLRQHPNVVAMLADYARDNLACGASEAGALRLVEELARSTGDMAIVSGNDLRALVEAVAAAINAAGHSIAALDRIERRTGLALAIRPARSTITHPDFHLHDRLVQEVLDRMAGRLH